MTVTKHYEHDHVILYVEEDGKRNCITLESDAQIRRLADCLIDIDRTGARTAKCEPKGSQREREREIIKDNQDNRDNIKLKEL